MTHYIDGYVKFENQQPLAYHSLYLSIFLSIREIFPSYQLKFYMHVQNDQVYYWKQDYDSVVFLCLLFLLYFFSHLSLLLKSAPFCPAYKVFGGI